MDFLRKRDFIKLVFYITAYTRYFAVFMSDKSTFYPMIFNSWASLWARIFNIKN